MSDVPRQIRLHMEGRKRPDDPPKPVMGWIACAFGVLGIVSWGVVFVPLAFVCSIIALFMGQGGWAFLGLLLAVIGLVTSPVLLGLIGLGAFAVIIDWPTIKEMGKGVWI